MRAVRQTIAAVLSLPSNVVLDADTDPDVSELKYFLTVGRITSQAIGDENKYVGEDEQEIITVSRLTTVSVNAFGTNAYSLIEKLDSVIKSSFAQTMFRGFSATVLTTSTVRNLPTAIAGGFEQRAQIDLTISHINRITTQLNRAEVVEISLHEEK